MFKLVHDETNTFFSFLEEVVIVTTSDNVVEKKKRTRTTSVAVFHGVDGNPLERQVVENITQFQVRSNLSKLVQTCPNVSKLVKTCQNLSKL